MPFSIQRVPRGLNSVLSIFGGQTPTQLEDRVQATIETLQFYGLQQRAIFGNQNAAMAEGGSLLVGPSNQWSILFSAELTITKTATMTAGAMTIIIARAGGDGITVASDHNVGPFGATETGVVTLPFVPANPILLPPPWSVTGFLGILGTDATANVILRVEIGLL